MRSERPGGSSLPTLAGISRRKRRRSKLRLAVMNPPRRGPAIGRLAQGCPAAPVNSDVAAQPLNPKNYEAEIMPTVILHLAYQHTPAAPTTVSGA
jgi:hypothetical protein